MKLLKLLFAATLPLLSTSNTFAQKYVGGDISVLKSYEDNNVAYYNEQGTKIDDVLKYMKSETVGWNAQRVRLFVNPTKKAPDGSTDAQVCQDLDYVIALCKRIKAEGFALMLDFHYSDTWADPSNQWTPAAWASLSNDELKQKIYDYTKECLQKLVEAEATPDFIQTGNEISYGMLWGKYNSKTYVCYSNSSESNWTRFKDLLTQATKACREVCPKAQIIIHSERSGDGDALKDYFTRLANIDYDVIGLSYYPFWHNSLSTLASNLTMLANNFSDKKVQIVETAYYYQWQPKKGEGIDYDFQSTWAISPEGQAAYTKALVEELNKHSNVNGLYWWFPEENGNGPDSKVLTRWVNRGLWDNGTHKALPALYELKNFAPSSTGIQGVKKSGCADCAWYSIDGRRLEGEPSKSGIYVKDKQKVAFRK
jgi:arabinogalactan endo-1,4-beta-galactosidase